MEETDRNGLTACFTAGADARAAGTPQTENPYPPACPEHTEWAAGWQATFDLDEEDDPLSNRLHRQDDPEAGIEAADDTGVSR